MARRPRRENNPRGLTHAQEIEFATVRSHKASEIAYNLCKDISQTCLVINGGAATAILAYLAKEDVDPVLYQSAAWSLALYGAGAFFSALMMFFIMQTADWWNYFWYDSLYPEDGDEVDYQAGAEKFHFWYYVTFGLAMACFFFASGNLGYSLVHAAKPLAP